jgi:hypothetical protein
VVRDDRFQISADAVKKQALVLEHAEAANLHIYIHSDRQKIERRVDEGGMKLCNTQFEEEIYPLDVGRCRSVPVIIFEACERSNSADWLL